MFLYMFYCIGFSKNELHEDLDILKIRYKN